MFGKDTVFLQLRTSQRYRQSLGLESEGLRSVVWGGTGWAEGLQRILGLGQLLEPC